MKLFNLSENDVLLYFDYVIGRILFCFFICECLGRGSNSQKIFIFKFQISVSQISC